MRADRLISIVLLLQLHKRMTAYELSQRLEVSERTIHRDMEALSMSGVPVFAERGTGGGWSLQEAYRANLTGLNEQEIQSLFLARPTHLLTDLGLHQASEAALLKLLVALPTLSRPNAEFARQRIHIDGAGWHQNKRESVPCLPIIQDALWQERKLLFSYHRSDLFETAVERICDPLGLVAKRQTWYMVALIEGNIRTYRVSRMQQAQIIDQSVARPADFDLATYWEQSTQAFTENLPCYHVTIRAAAPILPMLQNHRRFQLINPPDESGWSTGLLTVDVQYEACMFVLSYGADIEVLEPLELRQRVIQQIQEMSQKYTIQ